MKGRPPKDTTRHKADGTYQQSRHKNRVDVDPIDSLPDPPKDYSIERSAKFLECCAALKEMGTLATADLDRVRQYVDAYFDYMEAETAMAKSGKFQDTKGGWRVHPAWRVKNDASNTMRMMSGLLGFSPLDRMRIKVEKKETKGASILELMKGGKKAVND